MKKIGGDIELNVEFLKWSRPSSFQEFFPVAKAKDFVFVSLGRDALKLALKNEGLKEGEEVLVPAYTCMKVVDTLSELGLKAVFFGVDEKLNYDEEEILKKMSLQTKAIIFVNYFGFSKVDEAFLKSIKSKKEDVIIVMDYAQSLFSLGVTVLGSEGTDYIMTSMRKFLPIADGAFLIANRKTIDKNLISPKVREAVYQRHLGKILKNYFGNWSDGDLRFERLYLSMIYGSEEAMNLEREITTCSELSLACLKYIDFNEVASKRRENAAVLYETIDRHHFLFEQDPEVVPLAVPIRLPNRDQVRSLLMEQQIFLPVHWPLDDRISREEYPLAHWLSREMLCLVVDQRYSPEDMIFQAKVLNKIL